MSYVVDILESFLGEHRKHNETNGQVSFDCPACSAEKEMPEGDGKGNLEVNYQKDVFKCWVCKDTNNMYGPIGKLIKQYGTKKNLKDYRLFKPEFNPNSKRVETIAELPEGFKLLKDCTSSDFKYNSAIKYLQERNITGDIIQNFEIGYTTKGKFFNRIIIPSYDEDGYLNYFIARWFDKTYTKVKYLNPDIEKQTIIFNEGRVNWDATIYLVEGVTDHIVVPNSIPLLGKYVSDVLFEKLYKKSKANIVIVLDDDAIEDAKIIYNSLNIGHLSGRIRICPMPTGYDPSLVHQRFGKKGIIKVLGYSRKIENL